ncbi:hypothetical protein PF010_g9852 [Phytophthora fragariae]|uniref:Uncharacterized protein n=1 Tax=Phytophthora fragariae TaxID=53985 RepID=A0A6G0LBA9_9STRA|nr:hypothetical protein PF010_g9852 [Phytophthora fragariae]
MKLEDREGLSSSPDLIIISDTSDDEEDKPAPPKEVLGKRERPHDSDAPPRASSDGCPPCKRRLTEPFEQADAQPLPQPPIHAHTAVPPPKNRQPAPARLNYVIRELKVWRESASKPRAHEPPRTPPDAKATICSSPLSTLKQVCRVNLQMGKLEGPHRLRAKGVQRLRALRGSTSLARISCARSHLDCSLDDPDGYDSTGTLPPFMPSADDGPDSTFDLDEEEAALAAAASTVTSPATTKSSTLSTSKTVSRAAAKVANARASNGSSKTKKAKPSAVQVATSAKAIGATTADSRERLRYPSLADCSDRLGGVNLADMRDSLKKRTYAEFEEASYTKQKRLKAEKAAAELKRKLDTATESASGTGGDLVKTIMVLRADAERADADRAKAAEALRREERREEREYLEARRQEERRADREAQEERRREDCKEARQHMQDMLLMLSALKNGTIPNVCL